MTNRVEIKGRNGRIIFSIEKIGGKYYCHGNRNLGYRIFKEINRKAPNAYGNFYGREKAGAAACEELISRWDEIQQLVASWGY